MDFSRIKTDDIFYNYNERDDYPDFIIILDKERGAAHTLEFSAYGGQQAYALHDKSFREGWEWESYGYKDYKKLSPRRDIDVIKLIFRLLFGDHI